MFKGTFVALVTPFKSGKVDFKALETLVDWQIAQGIQGIVACGSTGESFCLSAEEQKAILKTVLSVAKRRVPIIAGTSSITLEDTLHLATQAEKAGVDGIMTVTPPYIKPTQTALIEYFTALHDKTSLPVILYDNPSRSGRSLKDATILTLAQLPRVKSLKDASGDLTRPSKLLEALPSTFTLLSGEDATTPGFLAQGGHGVISVTANVAPALITSLYNSWIKKDLDRLGFLRQTLNPLHRVMFIESSPAPAKYALSLLGLCGTEVRKPLLPATPTAQQAIEEAMAQAKLLKVPELHHG